VKDKARVGITTDIRNVWAMKTPNSKEYISKNNTLCSARSVCLAPMTLKQ